MTAPRWALLLFVWLGLCVTAGAGELEAHFIALDAHGESILLRTPGGRTVLVDAGWPTAGEQVVRYLERVGVERIDLLVLSHDDPDHVGGMAAVLRRFPVGRYWESRCEAGEGWLRRALLRELRRREIPVEQVGRGARLELEDGVLLEVLAPWRPFLETLGSPRANPNSVVLRVTHGKTRLLLTGDAEESSERRMLRAGVDLRCALLKVGHHGSDTSSSAPFLKATDADVAVICCEPKSPLGFPRPRVLQRLRRAGMRWYRTGANGNIVVRSNGESGETLRVSHERGRPSDPTPGRVAPLRLASKYVLGRGPAQDPLFFGGSGREVFHRTSCPSRWFLPADERLAFGSPGQARALGRRPCRVCRPEETR